MNFNKTTILTCAMVFGLVCASAQKGNLVNAKMAYDDAVKILSNDKMTAEEMDAELSKELGASIEEIEPATSHEKTMGMEKTWRYRAMIYELVARNLDKPNVAALSDDAIGIAAASYTKAMELDAKGSWSKENQRGINVIKTLAMQNGIACFNEEDFAGAFKMFSKADELSASMGLVDTTAIYNTALAAERGKDYANAIKYYDKAMALDYGKDMNEKAGLYSVKANLYRESGDEAMYEQTVDAGLEKYPSDQGLLIEKINIYLGREEMDKALVMLQRTLEQDPDNSTIQYNVGAVYDNLGEVEKAREAYEKAIAIDPDYMAAYYNLGATFYNEAAELYNKANDIPTHDFKAYEVAQNNANEVIMQAIPHLERAHELAPEDQATMASLAECYARTKQLEKRKAIMQKLGN